MKAEEVEVQRLFATGDQLLIPAWQRRYAWELPEWQELWSDLERVEASPNDESHFVGSVVLHAHEWVGLPSEAHRYSVVDGQQRITTLTILICAIRDHIAEYAETTEERQRIHQSYTAQLLRNNDLEEKYAQRLNLQASDQEALNQVIAGSANSARHSLVGKAYQFFKLQIRGRDQARSALLLTLILKKLSAVWVVLQPGDNAHRVFQTLNAGGKPLEQADLVRNYFFLLLGGDGDSFYTQHWKNLEKDLTSAEIEGFLVAWCVSQGNTGSKGSLFEQFQKDLSGVESNLVAVKAYGIEFVETAKLYSFIRDPAKIPNVSSATRRSLATLGRWGTVPAEGLLLHLLRLLSHNKLADVELGKAAEVILSFMARRFLAGYAPNRHKSIFVRATHRLLQENEQSQQDTVALLKAALSAGEDENAWPSDQALTSGVTSQVVYTKSRSRWAFLVLERVNRTYFQYQENAPEMLSTDTFTVEHILPQRLSKAWEEDLDTWGEVSAGALHESRLHVLGNLTLSATNPHLSNRRFSEKQAIYADDTLKLNHALLSAVRWDGEAIDTRGAELMERTIASFVSPLPKTDIDDLAPVVTMQGAAEIDGDLDGDIDDEQDGEPTPL